MVSDCPVDMERDVPCRITGYQKGDSLLLIVYKYRDEEACLPLDLAPYLGGQYYSYRICNEENQMIAGGSVEANGIISVFGEKDALYMVELFRERDNERV